MNNDNGAREPGLQSAAEALYQAQAQTRPTDPVRELLPVDDLAAAYEVQERVISRRVAEGFSRVGRKVGLTNPAVQEQLGVDQPDFGVLLADMDISATGRIDLSRLIAPRIEAEIAFVMARDVDAVDRQSVIDAVGEVVAAFEIVDSRIRDWAISIVDTVADNASSGLFLLGTTRVPLDAIDTVAAAMTMTEDGEVVSSGTGARCLGDPVNALVWVAETAARLGRPLRAGEIVLSGALGPMVPVRAGSTYVAEITGLGSITAVAGGEA